MNGLGWPSAVPFIIQIKNIYKKSTKSVFKGILFTILITTWLLNQRMYPLTEGTSTTHSLLWFLLQVG